MRVRREQLKTIHRLVTRWYGRCGRQFVWRTTSDPYVILVSEIMLQQTQVGRVKLLLPGFLKKFPTFADLARARRPNVIRAWKGMGYNARAVRLHALAQRVVREYDGALPDDPLLLRDLPGVGPYTVNAVRCFAFGHHVEVVDVNVTRVLSRIFRTNPDRPREIARLARRVLPGNAYMWNQALMDIGSTICIARKPRCHECPLQTACASARKPAVAPVRHGAKTSSRPEPSYGGIPRRLWRGKIVEALRGIPRRRERITLLELGRMVKPGFTSGELPWLKSVTEALTRDGVVEFQRPRHVRLAS